MKLKEFQSHYNIQGYYKNNIEHFSPNDLISGQVGDNGLRGIEGDIGDMGIKGQRGRIGPKGDKGYIGSRGISGPQGMSGPPGLPGKKGKQGLRGQRGKKGDQGTTGPMGERGPRGERGYTGPMGARGDNGGMGDPGPRGESGYKGFFTFKYGKYCKDTSWSGWGSSYTLKCPSGTVATKIQTRCGCGRKKWMMNHGNWHQDCGSGKTNAIDRDCEHKLTCCTFDVYDIPEKESMIKKRFFYGEAGGDKEEREINKIWITLKPSGLNKTVFDYPEGFFNSVKVGGNREIITDTIKKKPIPYAQECESQFCSKIGQLCIDGKVCLNEINEDTKCLKPPCWHTRPDPTSSPNTSTCSDIGQHCTQGKVCSMDTNKNCKVPPCWNKIPDLEKCPGKRCPTPGQQCSLGGAKYNLTGFVCKDEPNENPSDNMNEWCRVPPCWHKAPQFISNCPVGKCQIVGQKCENNLYNYICLDKPLDDCIEPPCWHYVNGNSVCSDILIANNTPVVNGRECPKVPKTDKDGKELKNADGKPYVEYDEECVEKYRKNKKPGSNLCKKEPIQIQKMGRGDIRTIDLLDSNGQKIYILKDCDYQGNCSNIGQKCSVNGDVEYECLDTNKGTDSILNQFERSKCNNPPCWVPVNQGPLEDKFSMLQIINNTDYKIDSRIEALEGLKKSQVDLGVYEFTAEDRKGSITFSTLYTFMKDNWAIFENNSEYKNAKYLWQIYAGGKSSMTYYEFGVLLRKINVEKFKYRDNGGRIYPKFMTDEEYDSIFAPYRSTG